MASKLAKSIAMRALVVNAQGGLDGPYDTSLLNVTTEADEALAHVRECLRGTARRTVDGAPCWCPSLTSLLHEEHCQRARELYKQLEIA